MQFISSFFSARSLAFQPPTYMTINVRFRIQRTQIERESLKDTKFTNLHTNLIFLFVILFILFTIICAFFIVCFDNKNRQKIYKSDRPKKMLIKSQNIVRYLYIILKW